MGQGSLPNIEFSQALGYKWPCTQSSLLVVFVCKAKICAQLFDYHAEGLTNTASVLSRDSSDSLRGNGTAAAFLQQARTSPSVAAMDTHTPAQRRLPSLGSHFGPPLCDHGGPATHQHNRHLAIQRNLPFLAWPSSFSRSVHVAPLPEAGASQGHSSTGGLARPLANPVVSLAEAAHDFNLRSRFGGAHRLRQTAVCSRGVQPSQTGATFLPPADLLRGASAGVLAWVAAPRQYREQHGSGSLLEALPGQGPAAHCSLSPPLPSRLGVFWQARGGVPGWPGLRLCDRGQAVLLHQARARECRFRKLAPGWEVGAFRYQPPHCQHHPR